jgi:hypothetical protein
MAEKRSAVGSRENLLEHIELIKECLERIEKGKDPKLWARFALIFLNGMKRILESDQE